MSTADWGLNSVPVANRWLQWDETPLSELRFTCRSQALPPLEGVEAEPDAPTDVDPCEGWSYEGPARFMEVGNAVETLIKVITDGPEELGQGFAYLLAPLGSAGQLPPKSMEPGRRLSCFLTRAGDEPGEDEDWKEDNSWIWSRGECDLSVYSVPAGSESQCLPEAYKPLYTPPADSSLFG